MDILIVDSDVAIKEYYTHLLESEFRNVSVNFCKSAREALEFLPNHACDIVLTETDTQDMPIFEFIGELSVRHIPSIVVSSDHTERLVVECLRSGALDFVAKQNIKLGHLPYVIARALLEADRWQKIQEYEASLPHRPEYEKLDQRVRSYLGAERMQMRRHTHADDKVRARPAGERERSKAFVEGQTYFIIYLYIQLYFPSSIKDSMDERRFLTLQNRILDRFVDIAPRYGGHVWTRKEDGCFFAFAGEEYLGALLAAVEVRASLNIFNMTVENLTDRIRLGMGITAGHTVYKEDKGQIYSEALNLCAHMAIHSPDGNATMLTSNVYEHLDPRAKKYLFKAGKFEGHSVFRVENIA